MNMLNINFSDLVKILPDVERRTDARTDWLELLNIPIGTSYSEILNSNYPDAKFIAAHDGKVVVLEHFLNNYFSPSDTIFITDGNWLPFNFQYKTGEEFVVEELYEYEDGEALTTDQVYQYEIDEYTNNQYDFIVNVSSVDSALEPQIKYWVDYYKQGGKLYDINFY
jgi:hypothetical protein